MQAFPIVERFLSIGLSCEMADVPPGRLTVVETPLRMKREGESDGYIRVLWWLQLADGRSVLSVPPGTGAVLRPLVVNLGVPLRLSEEEALDHLRAPANDALSRIGLPAVDRAFTDRSFACHGGLLHRHQCGECIRLVDDSIPPAEGLRLPTHCFPDGIAYGIVADHRVVSVAYAHRTGVTAVQIADLGVETAPDYRRRGFAKTAVSAVVEHVTRNGGEAYYCCRPDNHASVATATSVGFMPFGTSLILRAPWVEPQTEKVL
ncbi:MAG: GNAT family N-acetyltransferase [Armatimonadota bacterium]